MKTIIQFAFAILAVQAVNASGKYKGLEFLQPCSRSDQQLDACLMNSINLLTSNLRIGLPQLGFAEVEPIVLDEVQIVLSEGIDGYKSRFAAITARGVSQARVTWLKANLTDDDVQLHFTLSIPYIQAYANYISSGKFLLIKASGGGFYQGSYDNVEANVLIKAKQNVSQGQTFLSLQELKMDFSAGKIRNQISHLASGNYFTEIALNMFINNHSQQILKLMRPDLSKKLIQVMSTFVGKIFSQVPYDAFVFILPPINSIRPIHNLEDRIIKTYLGGTQNKFIGRRIMK